MATVRGTEHCNGARPRAQLCAGARLPQRRPGQCHGKVNLVLWLCLVESKSCNASVHSDIAAALPRKYAPKVRATEHRMTYFCPAVPCLRYFEVDEEAYVEPNSKMPYRIEMVGVTCDPGLAVARGIWRQVCTITESGASARCAGCFGSSTSPCKVDNTAGCQNSLPNPKTQKVHHVRSVTVRRIGFVSGEDAAGRANPLAAALAQAVQHALRGLRQAR